MVAWLPGRLSLEQYSGRRDACTAQELNLLLASPEFRRWQHQKASREARWRTLLSYGGVAALCLLLSVALSPPPSSLGRLEGVGSLELLAVTAGNVSSWRAPLPVGQPAVQLREQLSRPSTKLGRAKYKLGAGLRESGDLCPKLLASSKQVQHAQEQLHQQRLGQPEPQQKGQAQHTPTHPQQKGQAQHAPTHPQQEGQAQHAPTHSQQEGHAQHTPTHSQLQYEEEHHAELVRQQLPEEQEQQRQTGGGQQQPEQEVAAQQERQPVALPQQPHHEQLGERVAACPSGSLGVAPLADPPPRPASRELPAHPLLIKGGITSLPAHRVSSRTALLGLLGLAWLGILCLRTAALLRHLARQARQLEAQLASAGAVAGAGADLPGGARVPTATQEAEAHSQAYQQATKSSEEQEEVSSGQPQDRTSSSNKNGATSSTSSSSGSGAGDPSAPLTPERRSSPEPAPDSARRAPPAPAPAPAARALELPAQAQAQAPAGGAQLEGDHEAAEVFSLEPSAQELAQLKGGGRSPPAAEGAAERTLGGAAGEPGHAQEEQQPQQAEEFGAWQSPPSEVHAAQAEQHAQQDLEALLEVPEPPRPPRDQPWAAMEPAGEAPAPLVNDRTSAERRQQEEQQQRRQVREEDGADVQLWRAASARYEERAADSSAAAGRGASAGASRLSSHPVPESEGEVGSVDESLDDSAQEAQGGSSWVSGGGRPASQNHEQPASKSPGPASRDSPRDVSVAGLAGSQQGAEQGSSGQRQAAWQRAWSGVVAGQSRGGQEAGGGLPAGAGDEAAKRAADWLRTLSRSRSTGSQRGGRAVDPVRRTTR